MPPSANVARLFGTPDHRSLILAPMVRAGTLPLRLLSLHYGATTVFSEEIIAKKLLDCTRVENAELRTVDFVAQGRTNSNTNLTFRTCALERSKVVVQLGSANAAEALQAAELVHRDVAGIDLNMGCPEHFSIHGNMGAALLAPKPERAMDIIQTLRRNLPADVAVTCKVRLLEQHSDTVQMLQNLQQAGAEAITIHARRRPERPRDRARWEELEPIIRELRVPVIVNGSVFHCDPDYGAVLQAAPSASGVMVARGAMEDFARAFSHQGERLTSSQLADQYLGVTELCGPHFGNAKWFLSQLLRYRDDLGERKTFTESLAKSRTFSDLRRAFALDSDAVPHSVLWGADGTEDGDEEERWAAAMRRALRLDDEDDDNNSNSKRVRRVE